MGSGRQGGRETERAARAPAPRVAAWLRRTGSTHRTHDTWGALTPPRRQHHSLPRLSLPSPSSPHSTSPARPLLPSLPRSPPLPPTQTITPEEFAARFERPRLPCVVTGLTAGWGANGGWTPEALLQRFGGHKFKVG